jgi:hypothetical protein
MKKSINERIEEHIKRLQLACVPYLEYKGALEMLACMNKLSYPKMMDMLDQYKDYVIKNQKESED